tara:strand:- start:305 stop:811 length:507 start_codon:yes stop_codon:yes gene_type:complete
MSRDWRRANWWDYPDDDDTPGVIEEDQTIQEIMLDQGIEGPKTQMQGSGIMQLANEDPMLVEEYKKHLYDAEEQGFEPMSFEKFKIQIMAGGIAKKISPDVSIEEVVKEFIREKGRKPNSLDELKEFYEISVGTAKASPEMDTVKELIEEDKTKITLASGGLAGILGV